MVNYRRLKIAGSCYFFTVALKDRKTDLLIRHIDLFREAVKEVYHQSPFITRAIVVLPEHLHALWELPGGNVDYANRWRKIKGLFTKKLRHKGMDFRCAKDGTYSLWQRRYWEHVIRDEKDFQRHINYIHYNPVKHQLVQRAKDWPYSSFHYYVQKGKLENTWGDDISKVKGDFGE